MIVLDSALKRTDADSRASETVVREKERRHGYVDPVRYGL